eukprot:4461124-Amphidinium_carterae.1
MSGKGGIIIDHHRNVTMKTVRLGSSVCKFMNASKQGEPLYGLLPYSQTTFGIESQQQGARTDSNVGACAMLGYCFLLYQPSTACLNC